MSVIEKLELKLSKKICLFNKLLDQGKTLSELTGLKDDITKLQISLAARRNPK